MLNVIIAAFKAINETNLLALYRSETIRYLSFVVIQISINLWNFSHSDKRLR